MLNGKCTICSACEPRSAIWSVQKPIFLGYLLICCVYSTNRYLEVEIWWFSCRCWQQQRQRQTYRPITLPLAHARRVITTNVALRCMVMTLSRPIRFLLQWFHLTLSIKNEHCTWVKSKANHLGSGETSLHTLQDIHVYMYSCSS